MALAGVGLLLFATGFVLYQRQIHERELELAKAIYETGGQARLRPPLDDRLRAFLDDRRVPGTEVFLPYSDIDDAWLREHDYLCDLHIDSLTLGSTEISATTLGRVLAEHSLKSLFAANEELNAEAIAALAGNGRLEELFIAGSNLTDADFARLPLEQIKRLDVSETGITSQGLQALRRCHILWDLDVDGTQFNKQTARVLVTIPTLTHLSLTGPQVTDEHVRLVSGLPHLEQVQLWSTGVSEAGKQELGRSLPGVKFIW